MIGEPQNEQECAEDQRAVNEPDHVTCVSHDEVCWVGVVNAPQGGLNYTHRFEGATPSEVMRSAADSLDLSGAEQVMVAIERVALEDGPRMADLKARLDEACNERDDAAGRIRAISVEMDDLRERLGAQAMSAQERINLRETAARWITNHSHFPETDEEYREQLLEAWLDGAETVAHHVFDARLEARNAK